MAEILITHSYFLHFDPKQWKLRQPYPPLATMYAASALRDHGYDIAFYDTMFSTSAGDVEDALKKHHPKYFIICDDGFNYLTKMCLTNMREAAFDMIRIAKKYGCKVMISSSDSTDHPIEYLAKGADIIIVGEAEQTLLQTINALKSDENDLAAIAGLRYMNNGQLHQTAKRENLKDLDQLPFPAWDLVNIQEYKMRWQKANGYFSLNMGTTRGCPFKCNWCAKPIYGNRYNSRSPENVIAELVWLRNNIGFDHIWFCDDIFGLKPGWVVRFAELVKKENLNLRFKIQSRVDLLLEENNIAALAEAGCDEVWVGAESGSQKILDAMDKGTSVQQIHEATGLMKKKGIKPCFFLQFGYPGEMKEDIHATLNMLFALMPHDIGISVSYPLPGTKFYDIVKDQLKEKTNWTDSDELAMMFDTTYPTHFYKKLQRYVHREFRKRQAIESWKRNSNFIKALSLTYRIPQSFFSKTAIRKYVA